MTIICRLLRVAPATERALRSGETTLEAATASAKDASDVYRYWGGVSALLGAHAPGSAAARWRHLGAAVGPERAPLPRAQALAPAEVAELAAALAGIAPEDLAPHYDAERLDLAETYPACWARWEETFDPLGQLLEHYHFLRQFTAGAAAAGEAALFVYEDDGDPPWVDDD